MKRQTSLYFKVSCANNMPKGERECGTKAMVCLSFRFQNKHTICKNTKQLISTFRQKKTNGGIDDSLMTSFRHREVVPIASI